jgi:hypothetical protein
MRSLVVFLSSLDKYQDSTFGRQDLFLPYTSTFHIINNTRTQRSLMNTTRILVLWHVDPLVDNERETDIQTVALKQQQKNGVFCAVRGEMLKAGPLVRVN